MTPRNRASWIEGFLSFTEKLPSPELFRRWAAISAVSSALERKVWTVPTHTLTLYPNTYIILVGPPGTGKTVATSQVQRLLRTLKEHHLASSSLTKASLMDELEEAKRTAFRPGEPLLDFNFLTVLSNELGVLIPAYDSDFMSALTDIWDGHGYSERRRSSKIKYDMPNAQFNLLAGTTPSYLSSTLPPGAWDQGFLSRTMIVFSGATDRRKLFETSKEDTDAFQSLAEDLGRIAKLMGRMRFEDKAAELISEWHMAGGPPVPEHPKLTSYNERRTHHLFKLCMILSASESDSLIVTEKNFIEALDLLTFTEAQIPDVFKAMNTGGDARAIEDLHYFCLQKWTRDKKPIPEGLVFTFLSERVPAYSVEKIIKVMVTAGILEQVFGIPGIGTGYKPRPQRKT